MARIIYSQPAFDDLDRLTDFLLDTKPEHAGPTIELIIECVSVLENHRLIGGPIGDDLRELLMSRGRTGYVALYSLEQSERVVLVLAIRHQREAGYD